MGTSAGGYACTTTKLNKSSTSNSHRFRVVIRIKWISMALLACNLLYAHLSTSDCVYVKRKKKSAFANGTKYNEMRICHCWYNQRWQTDTDIRVGWSELLRKKFCSANFHWFETSNIQDICSTERFTRMDGQNLSVFHLWVQFGAMYSRLYWFHM